ncbi:MAG: hypothetical protein JWO32_2557 [Bacteroidetes bacterium]|nr:hypothetical protein [Bacteroidota bacterium]
MKKLTITFLSLIILCITFVGATGFSGIASQQSRTENNEVIIEHRISTPLVPNTVKNTKIKLLHSEEYGFELPVITRTHHLKLPDITNAKVSRQITPTENFSYIEYVFLKHLNNKEINPEYCVRIPGR